MLKNSGDAQEHGNFQTLQRFKLDFPRCKNGSPLFLKIVSSHANVRNTFFDHRFPQHPEVISFMGRGHSTFNRHTTYRRTLRLLDWPGPDGQVSEKWFNTGVELAEWGSVTLSGFNICGLWQPHNLTCDFAIWSTVSRVFLLCTLSIVVYWILHTIHVCTLHYTYVNWATSILSFTQLLSDLALLIPGVTRTVSALN